MNAPQTPTHNPQELSDEQAFEMAAQCEEKQDYEAAIKLYMAVLTAAPNNSRANHRLGKLVQAQIGHKDALPYFKKALDYDLQEREYWTSYLTGLMNAWRLDDAITLLSAAKRFGYPKGLSDIIEAKVLDYRNNPSIKKRMIKSRKKELDLVVAPSQKVTDEVVLVNKQKDLARGVACFKRFKYLYPGYLAPRIVLIELYHLYQKRVEAYDLAEEGLKQFPYNTAFYLRLAKIYDVTFPEKAKACIEIALTISPDSIEALTMLAGHQSRYGLVRESHEKKLEILRLAPNSFNNVCAMLFDMCYLGDVGPRELLEKAKIFGNLVIKAASTHYKQAHQAKRAAKNTHLRVGFVSGDFRSHPVSMFSEGLFANINKNTCKLIAYTNHPFEDGVTERLKPHFNKWATVYDKTDAEAAELMYNDGLDILIDLSGHTSHNRLPVFAYKPAPVQVSWLGYIATTGVPEIDYVIGDPYCAPPEFESHFTEQLWRLPETLFSMTPFEDEVPATDAPALVNGYVTFGSFANYTKVTDRVMDTWCEVMQQVPNSRFLLRAKQFGDASMVERALERFESRGIERRRITVEGPSAKAEYWRCYSRIDFVLDVFPYPGITTSAESYWAGVPVLTLKGDRFGARLGVSIANNVGVPEWVADSTEDYVRKAVAFSADPQALTELRHRLKRTILQTPLYDNQRFARHFEQAMAQMWQRYVEQQGEHEQHEQVDDQPLEKEDT